MPSNQSQSQQARDRDNWMSNVKKMVYDARSNLKLSGALNEAEQESLLGSETPTVLLDKVQVNPVNPVIRVDVTAYERKATSKRSDQVYSFPGAYGTALIRGNGTGSLSEETHVLILPYRQEAPRGNRRETEDQMSVRHAMNDQLVSIFNEEELLDTAKAVQARMIIPAIHTHEDGTMKAFVYIMADNIFPTFRGRLEYSRTSFMAEKEELPEVNEDPQDAMDDEMIAALTA